MTLDTETWDFTGTRPGEDKLDAEVVLAEINAAARGVSAASTKLSRLLKQFENEVDDNGEVSLGVGARYEIALETETVTVYEEAVSAEKRPPAEDIRKAIAKARLRKKNPELVEQYRRLITEIEALRGWIRSQRDVISGKQTVLNGLRGLGA